MATSMRSANVVPLHPFAPLGEPTATTGPPVAVARGRFLRDARDDTAATRGRAIAAMVTVAADIERLWNESLSFDDRAMTETLAVVSHALQQVARLLEAGDRIG